MPPYPDGLVTLVFTDLESSSELSERYGAAFEAVRQEHFEVLRSAAHQWHGYEVETAGDALFLTFSKAADAVQFAVDAQRAIMQHEWPQEVGTIRVRIGMHTGEPFIGSDRGRLTFRGPATNRAARVQAAGHGGQILISNATYESAKDELTDGDMAPAITFQKCGLHRLKGIGEELLWQVCHQDLHQDFPPLNTLNPERHNLPVPATPLVGRETEINAWSDLLRRPLTRLLTLVGMGGVGKSRLALQLAELCVQDFSDGAWWVDLQEARSGDDIVTRLAQALRLYLQPVPTVKEQVWNFLRERKVLLILDNTEQIPDAPGIVKELLDAASGVKCVVSSRRPLRLQAELLCEVLPLPPVDAERLFVERAQMHKASFAVTPDNALDIAQLCRRLEGVPLALELASSRVIAMSPREILNHLDQQFRILKTRAPDLPPRQRALYATIDWSYELLAEEDQALFAQLSVFVRGFTLEDAAAVCDPLLDIFEGVEELRRQSLLRSDTDADTQHTRFFMMESVRTYALEKIKDCPEEKQIYKRHGEHFLRLAQSCLNKFRSREEVKALQELEANSDNMRAAINWACTEGEYKLCAELALALSMFLERRGLAKEALSCIETGLEAERHIESEHDQLLAQLCRERAGVYVDQLEPLQVQQCAKEALSLFEGLNDHQGRAQSLNLLGLAAKRDGDFIEARRCFNLALEHFRLIHDQLGVSIVLTNLGAVECEDKAGNREAAAEHLQEALRIRRMYGDERGVAEVLNNLGVLRQEQGELREAQHFYEEALSFERSLCNTLGAGRVLYNLSEIAESEGAFKRALRLSLAADRLFEDVGSPLTKWSSRLYNRAASLLQYTPETVETLRHDLKEQPLEEIINWSLTELNES